MIGAQVPGKAPPQAVEQVSDVTNLLIALVVVAVLFIGGLVALGAARRARVRREIAERKLNPSSRVDAWAEAGRRMPAPDEEGLQ